MARALLAQRIACRPAPTGAVGVHWLGSGRVIDSRKKGAIASTLPPILQRLGITPDHWLDQGTRFEAVYRQQRRRSAA
ncbi:MULTISPECIES: hypothetical protein [unclassified Ectothiorhodospira]|uniref:hypothetical protein n=1 Tax=unclassified Ectothiorhodospira TaxID=2684909 RepID=UPI001EE7CFDD|nr:MULTISPECIES: hypothetical protein [unclassified Ectothiorhodospira]MCG5516959.1 hypothetical protein [Ectothiorhodospira sp. 9100]MCG5519877.1 hypothetical protein [Ectothiorhodospira sp. 9905]